MSLLTLRSIAGGGAYWMAKRSIATDREARAQAELERRQRQQQLLDQERFMQDRNGTSRGKGILPVANGDRGTDPSHEASQDPAPISHAPSTEGERLKEKSKYEASEPWRSRKGDRFS